MQRILWLLVVLCLILTACGTKTGDESGAGLPADMTETETQKTAELPAAVSEETLQEILTHCAVFFPDSAEAYIRGNTCTLSPAPFLEDGVLYVPAAQVAALLGGSFVQSGDFYYLNYMGNVSILMEEYNVMLFNSDSVILDRTPVLREGVLCLPLSSMSKALSMGYGKSVSQGIYLLGVEGAPQEAVLAALRQRLLGEALAYRANPRLQELADAYGLEISRLEQAADQKTLWRSDDTGVVCRLWLDDGGQLHSERFEMSFRFPENRVFVSEKGQLRCLTTGEVVSDDPEKLYRQELREATGRYMELLAAWCISGDTRAGELLAAYRDALEGNLTNEAYTQDRYAPYETGLYDHSSGAQAWDALLSQARPGDFLVFSASGAGPEYGFFNHSALILEVNREDGILRLLHARGSEYGVGADLEMDYLSFSAFDTVEYYRDYETVFLCRAGTLTAEQAEDMAAQAYEKFNGYQFGYGGRLGLEETNCAELIVDAYAMAGVSITDDNYETRLKEVLKGNTKNLVPIPDDLLLSRNVEVIGVWKR